MHTRTVVSHMDYVFFNTCETTVKIMVFDEKNHVKNYFLVGSHRFTRFFLFLFDYHYIYIYTYMLNQMRTH